MGPRGSAGCSAGGGSDTEPSGTSNGFAGTAGNAFGGSSFGGSSSTGGSSFGGSMVNNGVSTIGDCGGQSYQGQPGRLDMFIMMDRSGSMIFPFNLWQPVGTALGTFVAAPEAAGIGVGIQFFEINDGSCNVADYAQPAVPIGLLPGNTQPIQQAIVSNGPLFGGTPTRPALEGAIQYARSWASQNGTKTIVLLATDGAPEECESTVQNVSQVAADGLAGSPSIQTYVIGLGDIAALNEIALAGGTNQAFIVPADPAVASAQFLAAMNAIRGAALPCDYAIPPEANDLSLVNVEFVGGGVSEVVPNVVDSVGCGAGGWYYDNPTTPGRIIACPESCTRFNTAGTAAINVVVGCPTVVIQ